MTLIYSIGESTSKYLESFGVKAVNIDYIGEKHLLLSINAIPVNAKAFQFGAPLIELTIVKKFSKKKFARSMGRVHIVL